MVRKIFKKDGTVEIKGLIVERGSLGTSGFRINLKNATIPQEVLVHLNNSADPKDVLGKAKLYLDKNELKADITLSEVNNTLDECWPSISGEIKRKQGIIVSMHITHVSFDSKRNSDLTIKSIKQQIIEIERQGF